MTLDDTLYSIQRLIDNYANRPLEFIVKRLISIKSDSEVFVDIKYLSTASMGFTHKEVDSIEYSQVDDSILVKLSINFFGLQTVNSPLSLNLHESIIQDISGDSYEIHDFYNFFNQRAYELLAQSFYKKSSLDKEHNVISDIFSGIFGLGLQMAEHDTSIYHRLMKKPDLLFTNKLSSTNIAELIRLFFDFISTVVLSNSAEAIWLDKVLFQIKSYRESSVPLKPVSLGCLKLSPEGRMAS